MKANEDKHLEKFIDKVMKETSLETPPFDFASKVMLEVLSIKANKSTVYKPLISKLGWFAIFGCTAALVGFIIIGGYTESNSWFSTLDFSGIFNNRIFNELSGFKFSKITTYAIVLPTVMLLIQIALLKNQMDKRFEQ